MSSLQGNAVRIMGVDPGSFVTGFAVLDFHIRDGFSPVQQGVIVMNSKESFSDRLLDLGKSFQGLLDKYKPQHVVLESIYFGKNADSAFKLGHVRGVLMYCARTHSAEVYEYGPRLVRKTIVGSGGASKEQVRLALLRILNWGHHTHLDAWDATALAVYHGFRTQKKYLFQRRCSSDWIS